MDVVIDTNVIITAMRSRYGASNRLLQELATGKTTVHISVPLFLEYAEVLLRFADIGVTEYTTILSFIDTIVPSFMNNDAIFIASAKDPPGLNLKSNTNPFIP